MDQILTTNSDYVATFPGSEMVYASEDGQIFESESLRGLTNGASEPLTDGYSSGQHESPDHTLVYNAVYQSCRDLTACGSWDEIYSSTPNRKSKSTMHGMHLKNLSTTSIQSVIEYAPSCLSDKVDEHVLSPSPPKCIRSTGTSFPNIPTTRKIYPPDALLTTPDQYLSTVPPSVYIPLTTLGQSVHGKVFAAQLKDNSNDKFYTLKTIPKVNLGQRGVAEVTKELEILRLITDASLSNKPFPFLQKLKENFQDEINLFIVLEYFPTTLANTETATLFRLPQMTTSPSKTYGSEQEAAIQALRFLAAELTLGLLFLHRRGIVHQDIKPANIMISEGGHAVIGEFGAASTLPIQVLGQTGDDDDDPIARPRSLSCMDDDGTMVYKSIVLQPEDTVTFTALYAAPELLERKGDGTLIYDERVDWWSLGISLYEITTGGVPFHISSDTGSIVKGRRDDSENGLVFDLLEGLLNLTGGTTRACDAHLDGYLRSLLVHDPRHRLSGERAKSHPFLGPLADIWTEIEDLRHPPCPKPSARVLYGGDTTDISFDLQEDSSKFDAHCTQTSYSGRQVPESPQTPLQVNEEYYTPREVFSSPEQTSSLESPLFLTRRREALAVKRPGGQILWNDSRNRAIDAVRESESSVILQKEAFMSYYIETSFQTNGSFSVGNNPQALPSTDSAGQFFSDEHVYGTCTIQRRLGVGTLEEESFDEDKVRAAAAETSFTDSGLDFPLGSSPESWGHRKSDSFRKPLALQQPIFQGLVAKDTGGQKSESLPAPAAKLKEKAVSLKPDLDHCQWTFDEKITISLLEAGLRKQERFLEPVVNRGRLTRLSRPQLVAAASERIMKAAGRRVVDVLRRRQ